MECVGGCKPKINLEAYMKARYEGQTSEELDGLLKAATEGIPCLQGDASNAKRNLRFFMLNVNALYVNYSSFMDLGMERHAKRNTSLSMRNTQMY